MKFMPANRKAPDRTPRFVLSHLGLFCLTKSHKQDDRLIWVKEKYMDLNQEKFTSFLNELKITFNFLSRSISEQFI